LGANNGGKKMWYNYNSKAFNDMLRAELGLSDNYDASTYHLLDKGDHYTATIPLPGANKEDIKISIKENGILSLSYSPEKKNPYAASFNRAWKVLSVDLEAIKADYVDGVLTLTVPKVKPPVLKVKTILVN
jgi:HSP20 family molecular chaperone IbpA